MIFRGSAQLRAERRRASFEQRMPADPLDDTLPPLGSGPISVLA